MAPAVPTDWYNDCTGDITATDDEPYLTRGSVFPPEVSSISFIVTDTDLTDCQDDDLESRTSMVTTPDPSPPIDDLYTPHPCIDPMSAFRLPLMPSLLLLRRRAIHPGPLLYVETGHSMPPPPRRIDESNDE